MPVRPDPRIRRIASIASLHAELFDGPVVGLELGSGDDYRALAASLPEPSAEEAKRLRSLIRAHALLFGAGPLGGDEATSKEAARLEAYLASLTRGVEDPPARAAVLPKTLGMSFARKGLGVPLFGLFRPAVPPPPGGLVLKYQSRDADGTARLSTRRVDAATRLRYAGYGVEISGDGAWLNAALPPAGSDWRHKAGRALGRKAPWIRDYGSCSLIIGAAPVKSDAAAEIVDPLEYRYAYYFRAGAERANLGRFLRGLLSGTFGVPTREAEEAVDVLIARSP